MAKIIKLVWGVLPFIFVSLCVVLITMFERITGNTLRILSRNLLILLWVISFGVVLFWGQLRFNAFRQKAEEEKANRIMLGALSILLNVLSALVMGCLILGGVIFAILSHMVPSGYWTPRVLA